MRNYSRINDPQLNDLALLWDSSNSDWRLCTLSDIEDLFCIEKPETSKASPTQTGWNVQVPSTGDITLLITPADNYADGTVTLPPSSYVSDKQSLVVYCEKAVTNFTVDGNGATVKGAPTTLTTDSYFSLFYDEADNTWYRVA